MKSFMLSGTTATLVTCTKRAADSRTVDVGDRERTLRVRSALQACGVYEPQPAFPLFDFSPTAKGGALDLCAAIEILQLRFDRAKTDKFAFVGELSLNGTFRSTVRGVVSMVRAAKAAGLIIVIPAAYEAEAACVHGAHVLVAETLREVIDHLEGTSRLPEVTYRPIVPTLPESTMADVSPKFSPAHAIEAVRAVVNGGSRGVLLVGRPGGGKTMIGRRVASLFPVMTQDEALDVTAIHSAAGLTAGLPVTTRPFRAPHFTVSDAGLVGGGNPARPGEVSLAHHGVLFLDELDEFRRTAIDALACAVRDENVDVRGVRMPARPYLVAAANPCPCGHAGTDRCHCGDERKAAYRKRLNAYREALNLVEVEI